MEPHPRIKRVEPAWAGEPCVVAAPGPSLTAEIAHRVRMLRWYEGWRAIVVQDAYKLLPFADALYGCDSSWWDEHKDCKGFRGEKWSCHQEDKKEAHGNDKRAHAEKYDLNLVWGRDGDEFSFDPSFIRYGSNSGFQAINLALLFGCTYIVLVGFDMRHVGKSSHFFGDHPKTLAQRREGEYERFVEHFNRAAKRLPSHVRIVNATEGSALTSFPMMSFDDATRISGPGHRLHCDRAEPQAAAG